MVIISVYMKILRKMSWSHTSGYNRHALLKTFRLGIPGIEIAGVDRHIVVVRSNVKTLIEYHVKDIGGTFLYVDHVEEEIMLGF